MSTGTLFVKINILYIMFFLFCLNIPCTYADATQSPWTSLAPGLLYQDLLTEHVTPWSHIHVFQIDPRRYQFKIATKEMANDHPMLIQSIAEQHHALIAINGGFFDTKGHSIGLRISDGKTLSPLKKISWWGIFYLKDHQLNIDSYKRFRKQSHSTPFAIQAGPRLLIQGHIPKLKSGVAERTALGITASGQLIILVTEHNPISTETLAHVLQAPTLNCVQALNLDGGSSTQLYAHIGTFKKHVRGFAELSDAMIITPL